MKISKTLSGLLSEVVYQEEVVVDPNEELQLQNELQEQIKQIETNQQDLSIVSESMARTTELTSNMQEALDTNQVDQHTVSLMLSDFSSIHKTVTGQAYLFPKNLSANPLDARNALTAGLQAAEGFLEKLKGIALKIWEKIKAGFKWFMSKAKDFIKWIITKLGLMSDKAEDAADILATASVMTENKDLSKRANSIFGDLNKNIDKQNDALDKTNDILDRLIKDVNDLLYDFDVSVEKEAGKVKQEMGIKSSGRAKVRKPREILGITSELKTMNDVNNALKIIADENFGIKLFTLILQDESISAKAVQFEISYLILGTTRLQWNIDKKQYTTDLYKEKLEDMNKGLLLQASKDSSLKIDSNFAIELMYFSGKKGINLLLDSIFKNIVENYTGFENLFKTVDSLKAGGGSEGKYILDNYIESTTPIIVTGLTIDEKSNKASVSGANAYGQDSYVINLKIDNVDTSAKAIKDLHGFRSATIDKIGIDSVGKNLSLEPNIDMNLKAITDRFDAAINQAEKFKDYFIRATAQELSSKGETLINNLFVVMQNLNASNPSRVLSVISKMISDANSFYSGLNIDSKISEIKKTNN